MFFFLRKKKGISGGKYRARSHSLEVVESRTWTQEDELQGLCSSLLYYSAYSIKVTERLRELTYQGKNPDAAKD